MPKLYYLDLVDVKCVFYSILCIFCFNMTLVFSFCVQFARIAVLILFQFVK